MIINLFVMGWKTPSSLKAAYRRFGSVFCHHHQGGRSEIKWEHYDVFRAQGTNALVTPGWDMTAIDTAGT